MRTAAQAAPARIFTHAGLRAAGAHAGDALVGLMFATAARLAPPVAAFDELLRPRRSACARIRLWRANEGRTDGSSELRTIWFARIAREGLHILLIMGFVEAVLRRVEVTGGPGTLPGHRVYAIYHSPWGRVLALWMARRSGGFVLSARRWLDRAGSAHLPCTWRGLRELVRRVRHGSSAAVTVDHFGKDGDGSVTATLLGRDVYVSTGAARIAVAAGVPIVPVMTRYASGKLQIALGDEIAVDETTVADVTRRITEAFDAELRGDPSGWERAHRFLSAAPATPRLCAGRFSR